MDKKMETEMETCVIIAAYEGYATMSVTVKIRLTKGGHSGPSGSLVESLIYPIIRTHIHSSFLDNIACRSLVAPPQAFT